MRGLFIAILLTLLPSGIPVCDEQRLERLAQKADAVVVAEVTEVGPAPGAWSGTFAVAQRVRYRLKDVLKGSIPAQQIEVGHYVVANSATADGKEPRLSRDLFSVGNELVLFLVQDPKTGYIAKEFPCKGNDPTYLVTDETCGAVKADDAVIRVVRRFVSSK